MVRATARRFAALDLVRHGLAGDAEGVGGVAARQSPLVGGRMRTRSNVVTLIANEHTDWPAALVSYQEGVASVPAPAASGGVG
jgi:hypothetical protein